MTLTNNSIVALSALAIGAAALDAQSPAPPPLRTAGGPVATSARSFRSISSVRLLPGGRLLINDVAARRVLLTDTLLGTTTIIADNDGSTATDYGPRPGGLIPFAGDSTVFVETQTPAMYMIDPHGAVVRTMAVPNPRSAVSMTQPTGGAWTASDPRGRYIYRGSAPRSTAPVPTMAKDEVIPWSLPDTGSILRIDPATRVEQVLGWYKALKLVGARVGLGEGRSMVMISNDPLAVFDDFAVLSDGTIVVLRADMHLDRIDLDGVRTSTPRIPYPWQHMSDSAKAALIDSVRAADDAEQAKKATNPSTGPTIGAGGGGGGGGLSGGGSFTPPAAAKPYVFVKPDALPDYRPAFEQGALRVDARDRLWIRTLDRGGSSTFATYYVVSRDGKLLDRIELRADRTIAGFDASSVYLVGRDGGVAWLERVRILP